MTRAIRAIGDTHRWTRVTVRGVDHPIYLRLARRNGSAEIVCTGVIIGIEAGAVVRAQDLRIPLAQVMSEVVSVWDVIAADRDAFLGPAVTRPGRGGRDRAFFEKLADHYRKALGSEEWHSAPTKYLYEHVYRGVPKTKVRYWLNEARKRGILGRSEKGKAGEARKPRRRGRTK